MHSGILSLSQSQRDAWRHRVFSDRATRDSGQRGRIPHHHGHQLWTRRHVLQASVALLGTTAAVSVYPSIVSAARPGTGLPKQLPDFSPALKQTLGVEIPFFLPIEVDPFTTDPDAVATPTTIWDFNGMVGLVEADGVSNPEHTADEVPRRWACDIRFMRGVFVDRDGRRQRGAFSFLWLDIFEDPSLGPFVPGQTQLHDFNPGDLNVPGEPNHFPDGGVFWTREIPPKSVKAHPGRGNAAFTLSDFSLFDYTNVVNAILRDGPAPIPGTASVDIDWTGTGERLRVRNDEAGFRGSYENASATVEWSAANNEGYFFSTAESSEVTVSHAFTAHVRNGVFHP